MKIKKITYPIFSCRQCQLMMYMDEALTSGAIAPGVNAPALPKCRSCGRDMSPATVEVEL